MRALERIFVIASHTFTQLVRMKVFGFLAVFALILIGAHFFELPNSHAPDTVAEEELRMMKSSAMGAMSLFSIIFAVAATGLLLPRDVEDRTLYTILCKPVPRFDYLAGKYLGVVFTIFIALLLMDLLFIGALQIRTAAVVAERMELGTYLNWTSDELDAERAEVLAQGATWNVQLGILAIWLKAIVIAGVALLISTFSTSTLFTIIMGFLIYFIGHFSGEAREYWVSQSGEISFLARSMTHIVSVLFPDFRLYNVIDGAIAGLQISLSVMGQLIGLSVIYACVYLLLSWFAFAKKEF